jgi:anti-sigma regulatory factor (Ser/Thr protein kinase)
VENTTSQDVGRDIVLSFPAHTTNLRIARLTASSVAADLGLGLEDTEDLRVAVTELSGALIDDHAEDARLELRFRIEGEAVVVEGRRGGCDEPIPELDPIARELLAVTTDDHVLESRGGDWTFTVRKGPSAL